MSINLFSYVALCTTNNCTVCGCFLALCTPLRYAAANCCANLWQEGAVCGKRAQFVARGRNLRQEGAICSKRAQFAARRVQFVAGCNKRSFFRHSFMSTDKKAIVISLNFDNCLCFVLFFSDGKETKNLIVSVLCRPSDRSHPRVSQMTEFFLTSSGKKIHAKSTKRSNHHTVVRIGLPLALLIIPFPSTIIEHSLLLCGMMIFHQMSHRLATHSRQDSRRSNSLSQGALAALSRMSATLLGLSLLAKNLLRRSHA